MRWWARLFSGLRLEKELDAELGYHLERQVQDNVRAGMTEGEARRRARDQFGDLEQVKEDCRAVRGTRWVEETLGDLRLACRLLARDKPFATAAVLTLALGIGANTAMFGVIEAVLIRPLPFHDPDALVWISERDGELETIWGARFHAWREDSESFAVLSPLLAGDADLEGAAPRVRFACVSAELSRLFGIAPRIGRDFSPSDFHHAPAAPGVRAAGREGAEGVAILSDHLFRVLGGSRDVVGRSLAIRGAHYTVVGVLPKSFDLPVAPSLQLGVGPQSDVDLFLSTTVDRSYRGPGALLGRLAPGASASGAASELETLARHTPLRDVGARSAPELHVVTLQERIVAGVRPTILILWACVGFVLLIACANAGGILLARLVARRREMSIRVALGAGRWRVVRQLLAENAVLTLGGGVAGVLLGWVGIAFLARTGPVDVPRLRDAALSPGVLLACGSACAMTMVALSVLPALRNGPGATWLSFGATGIPGSGSARRWQGALVVGELALTLTLLSGAGLMMRSLLRVHTEAAALAPERVLAARVREAGPRAGMSSHDQFRRNAHLLEQVESLPGVRRAALWSVTFGYPARVETLAGPPEPPVAMWFNVSPGFREASGVRLVAGRWFAEADRDARPPVVVVSERFAAASVLGGISPVRLVGRATLGPFPPVGTNAREAPLRIIGVVSDYRSGQFGILQPDDPEALPQVFYLDALRPMAGGELLVRTAFDPGSLLASVRRTVAESSSLRLIGGTRLNEPLSRAVAPRRFHTTVIAWFAAVALLLAAVGMAGVLTHAVAQRRAEIGVRMVLGADTADIRHMILRHAGTLLVAGLGSGLVGAALLARSIGSVLYGVETSDPAVHLGGSSLLATVALCAAYRPARQAMRISPWQTLRSE